MPAPPSSSGHGAPMNPSSPIFLTVDQGKLESRSCWRATGRISRSAKSRTISRT